MSRRRRRRGPGSAKGRNRGGPRRRILITSASPTGEVKGPGTTIQAFVEAMDGSYLSRHDIDVYLDGQPMRFSYGRSSGRLTGSTGSLSSGTHTVEIEAYTEDDNGNSKTGRKRWTFMIKK
ncbi:MAG: hypothetical protein M3385_05395 [Actinomycetota bacterium]|jgi:hypothetical protein|nr:hypothetical protein [Actinomycetota bacterium]